ncbi:carbohydrate ABC transporter permease [Halomonas sp. HP20-15]|uniref:carbohydrate ABC transporter permease n=1 Tax=Halomonas sp. HP20-15 TaxID=3085901 RepID=UPI002982103D|nr:carbohydrate ABC transporter permease [Halomonas sp. HP20-15]MDW5377838.1 carbohydrate ABC transporter permease [Halomonas sp. HP20-15]
MSTPALSPIKRQRIHVPGLETVAAWLLGIIWVSPLLYALWAAFHPTEFMVRFDLLSPLTWDNFADAWAQAPFARYYLNTFMLVTGIVIAQFVVCTLAGFAFARFPIPGKNVLFMLVLIQLFVFPEVLIVENYRIASSLGLVDTITGIGLPYVASALGIFLLRQTFKTIPRELEDAARVEGCGWMAVLLKVYVPLAKPTYLAYGLVSISHHWNNFLWPLVVTNSVESRPLTVGLGIFSAPETGVNWATVSAATLLSIAPLLVAFLLFQRQFVQSFLRAGIR